MNEKIAKHAKAEGFCCLWAFLETVRSKYTVTIYEDEGLDKLCTLRALQTARRKHRKGKIKCEKCEGCQKEAIAQARVIP